MKKRNGFYTIALLVLITLVTMFLSLMIGRYEISFQQIIQTLFSSGESSDLASQKLDIIINTVRLPRILAAFIVGGALAITGTAYQGMFRNPMVSPSILGVSSGAGFGAAIAITLSLSMSMIQLFAFAFGIVAVAVVYSISKITSKSYNGTLTLILSGMVVSAVFTSLISILKYVADPYDTLPSIVYWLMGGLSSISMGDLSYITIISIPALFFLTISGWKLDVLSFGDDEARSMGINVNLLRLVIIVIATILTAAAVSISGIIGWVGLIIPHITRAILGPKNTILLPGAFLLGGIFLMIVDNFSRSISSLELPLGITTSLIGAPFFIFILTRGGKHETKH